MRIQPMRHDAGNRQILKKGLCDPAVGLECCDENQGVSFL